MSDHKPRIINRSVYVLVVLMLASFNLSLLTSIVALVQFFVHFGLNLAMLIAAAFQILELVFDVAALFLVIKRTFKLGWGTLKQELADLLSRASQLKQTIKHSAVGAETNN